MRQAITTMILAAAMPLSAVQQMDAPARSCTDPTAALPETLAGWSGRTALTAAADAEGAASAPLIAGRGVDAALNQTDKMHYVVRPEKPGGSASYGGLFTFTVERPGIYRVALGSGAWIDMLRGEEAVTSTAHGHGPECSGVRKMVDFPLTPGRYVLQIAANGSATLPLLLVRLP